MCEDLKQVQTVLVKFKLNFLKAWDKTDVKF
jgi:hypothetical protein